MRPRPFITAGMTMSRHAGAAPRVQADGDIVYRMVSIASEAIKEDRRSVELTFSSDIELERWPGVIEVLSHASDAVDMSRLRNGAPLLFNHDPDEYIGVIESANIGADRKGRCVVRFSENEDAEKIWRDVQAGILRNVSVGYRIREVKLTEERENGTDVYVVSRWEPYEVSIVTIPADISVGIGRSVRSLFKKNDSNKSQRNIMNRDQLIAILTARGIAFATDATDAQLAELVTRSLAAAPAVVPNANTPAARVTVNEGEQRAQGEASERDRVRSIFAAGKQYDANELAQDAVEKGHTVEQFRTALVDHLDKRNKAVVDGTKPIGLSENEARSFSFIKLFRALTCEPEQRRKYTEEAAFELEACRAATEKLTHRSAHGTVVPVDVLMQPLVGQRNTIVGAQTASGYTNAGTNSIQTLLLTSSFIDLLRNRSFLMSVVTELSGLVGNIDIPRQLTGPAAEWIGEDAAGTSTGITFGLVSLRPRTMTSRSEITRKLLMQNSLGVEALLRADMVRVMALELDRAGLYGTGLNNQPLGLAGTSGINTGTWAAANAPTFAELVAMETAIAQDNADVQGMAYAFNAGVRGRFKTTRKFSDGNDGTIWEAGNTVNGYATQVSNVLTNSDVFFGNWADLLVGMWGGLDVTVDPYTHSDKGRIRITNFQDVDFAVRRADSFALFRNA